MIEIQGLTIGSALQEAVRRFGQSPLLVVPADPDRSYEPDGRTDTYTETAGLVEDFTTLLTASGYGHGHRVAVLLENRPENLIVKLACAAAGVSWVPVNPDYRPAEIAYLLQDSDAVLAIATSNTADLMRQGIQQSGNNVPLAVVDGPARELPRTTRPPPRTEPVNPRSEASLLYTSGTTGRPKGCILSHEYELIIGAWYANRGGMASIRAGCERVYNPLPLYHINAGIVSFFGMLLTGGCQILPERFSRTRWWREIRESEATIIHYLGVIIPVLLNEPPDPADRAHHIRFGFGAGLEPTVHGEFEERFGFPLIEGWGMTEMCRILVSNTEPRQIHTRAMGRPQPGLEIRVVDGDDNDVATGEPGEMIVRHSAETPRYGAFSGYLNQPEATEQAWRGGWFHTGDTVSQDETGMLYFVDRKKNIIRRSGENIAAAEIEACLQGLEAVAQVAVLAVEDELRDEEVFACIVPANGKPGEDLARELFDHCYAELAYYKAPGWIAFVDALPVTGTQKVLKHMIFKDDEDPLSRPGTYDLRPLKKRNEFRRS